MSLLILEDDPERLRRFKRAVDATDCGLTIRSWETAVSMIEQLNQQLSDVKLISLDHDLYVDDGCIDPGDGLDVARYLAELCPTCPVIIHTSNVDRGNQMQGILELAGWTVKRVSPIGSDWIEVDWISVVQELTQVDID